MAKKELPKAQLGKIISSVIKGGYQGIKTGYKTYKAASLAEKAAKLKKAQAAARAQKAAATRAANAKAAKAAKNSKTGTTKTGTTKTGSTKGKEPFVKSKARLATENVVGKTAGYATFGTANVLKRALKKPIIQGGLGIGTGLYIYDRYKKTNAPKKVKKIKK